MPQAKTYQCPNCNGVLVFDASLGKLRCEHCGCEFDEGEVSQSIPLGDAPVEAHKTEHARTVEDFLERAPWTVEEDGSVNAVVYSCPSCAAAVAADQSTVSTTCPYCGNNMFVSGTATTENIPQYVLPFSVTQEQAEARMRAHFEHKWYLSRQFDAELRHLQGMYVPYHLYDISVAGRVAYVGYEDESDSDDNSTTRYYRGIRRAGHASFEKIPVNGSSKMPDGHMDAISPFEFDQLRDFSASYAAGYLMEVADEDKEECGPRAVDRAVRSFSDDLKADARRENRVDGIEEVVSQDINYEHDGYASCVLPVWLMHCTWEDNQMLFAVNGETGKCVGDLPVETKRRVATIAATLLVLSLIALILFVVVIMGHGEGNRQVEFAIGAVLIVLLITGLVDKHFMSQMHTAVEATDASMSYTSEGLVVTERWASRHRTTSRRKARQQAIG